MPKARNIYYVKLKNHDDNKELSLKVLANHCSMAVKKAIDSLPDDHENYWPYYVSEGVPWCQKKEKRIAAGKRAYEKNKIMQIIKIRDDLKYLHPKDWQSRAWDVLEEKNLHIDRIRYFDKTMTLKRGIKKIEDLNFPENVK